MKIYRQTLLDPSTVVKVTTNTWPDYVREQKRQRAQRLAESLEEK